MAKAKGWRNNRSDIPDEPGSGNPAHPDHDGEATVGPAKEPKPKRKPKQKQLPGLETPKIKKIEDLADRYVERRNERMAMLQSEIASRDLLSAVMIEHGLKAYQCEDGKTIEFVATEKIKVRSKKEAGEEDEDDGD